MSDDLSTNKFFQDITQTMDSLIDSSGLTILENIARFAERRHEVLAGNVANINTPRYRMRDLPVGQFRQALKNAIAHRTSRSHGNESNVQNAKTVPNEKPLFSTHLFEAEESPSANITFQDANNRSIEHQMMEITKNRMMQAFAITVLQSQFQMIESVIREGR